MLRTDMQYAKWLLHGLPLSMVYTVRQRENMKQRMWGGKDAVGLTI